MLIGLAFAVLGSCFAIALAVQVDFGRMQAHLAHAALLVFSTVLGITMLDEWGPALDQVMSVASVRIPSATLVLGKTGCQSLETAGLMPKASASAAEEGCVIENVTVLSRVGASWPVECQDGERNPTRVTVKSDEVATILTGPAASSKSIDPRTRVSLCSGSPKAR